jgi:hypothetical protein
MRTNYYPNRQLEPLTAAAATVLAGGAQLAGTGINALSQGSMNRKTRQWNEKQYALQRQHSLQDWTMQNEYNSPAAQMQRLKMAGLNPNLVYGKGADNVSGAVRSSDAPSWNPQAPKFDLGAAAQSGLSAYYDAQIKDQTLDNLKQQNTVLVNDAALKAAQTSHYLQGVEGSKFDLGLKSELRSISLQAAAENLRKTQTDIDISISANERAAMQSAQSLETAVETILSMREQRAKTIVEKEQIRAQINNLKKDSELKQLDINLKRIGIQPGDNMFIRTAAQYLNSSQAGPRAKRGQATWGANKTQWFTDLYTKFSK